MNVHIYQTTNILKRLSLLNIDLFTLTCILPAIRVDSAEADLAELAELAELVSTMSVFQTHARNTDSARIRPFFRSFFGLSPMNVDMSVFLWTMSVFLGNQTHARNTDSARIRPFFRSLFGLSPMNVDMSVSLVMPETLT